MNLSTALNTEENTYKVTCKNIKISGEHILGFTDGAYHKITAKTDIAPGATGLILSMEVLSQIDTHINLNHDASGEDLKIAQENGLGDDIEEINGQYYLNNIKVDITTRVAVLLIIEEIDRFNTIEPMFYGVELIDQKNDVYHISGELELDDEIYKDTFSDTHKNATHNVLQALKNNNYTVIVEK